VNVKGRDLTEYFSFLSLALPWCDYEPHIENDNFLVLQVFLCIWVESYTFIEKGNTNKKGILPDPGVGQGLGGDSTFYVPEQISSFAIVDHRFPTLSLSGQSGTICA
jgi:hypothetical protein